MKSNNETIAAISTPLGEGGIGIVRLSGKDALSIADSIFSSPRKAKLSSFESHTVHCGHIKSDDDKVIDEVLVSVMKAPKTYTAEDIVEINCHGGSMPLKKVLRRCLSEGARLAEPGEFTKRAFLNGRIDLSQAEAVLDIIKASTDTACRVAVDQLKGVFSEEVRSLRKSILDVISRIELSIDFSQEDVEFPEIDKIKNMIKEVHCALKSLLSTADKGMILRDGANVVICGRPNVGKSSLMNALLKHDRVIVTPIAGTTRDVIEESINIAGIKVRITDTAGIIETSDRVELEGIKRSREKLANADLVIFMLDSSLEFSGKDIGIFDTIKEKEMVIVANKSDLSHLLDIGEATERFSHPIIEMSALKKEGLNELEDAIAEILFKGNVSMPEGAIVTNMRHGELLEKAEDAVKRAEASSEKFNGELLASDLNEAVFHLGLITGESVEDEVLDRIFSQFCIGK